MKILADPTQILPGVVGTEFKRSVSRGPRRRWGEEGKEGEERREKVAQCILFHE